MAPEQARGGPTDGHCDVYGLGVVAYQALTGRPPFVGSTSVEILVQHLNRPVPALAPRCPDAPYGLVELVERMLAKNYRERPTAARSSRAGQAARRSDRADIHRVLRRRRERRHRTCRAVRRRHLERLDSPLGVGAFHRDQIVEIDVFDDAVFADIVIVIVIPSSRSSALSCEIVELVLVDARRF